MNARTRSSASDADLTGPRENRSRPLAPGPVYGPIQCAWRTSRCDNPAMGERDAAQAAQLIRALCEVRDKMINRMAWLEKHGAQLEAAALRRDIHEAHAHITRLQRRYLGGNVQAAQPARQAR